jgi:sigma-B regulation protein RsbU (phosphoserine phosphatase)
VSLVLIDGKWPTSVRELALKASAYAACTVLIDDEKHVGDQVPDILAEGLVDDLLLTPLRPLELLSKIKHVDYLLRINEIVSVNSALKTLIDKFEHDVRTARAIQTSLIPEKFPPVQGFKVTHKYLSGMKSGGDYLDFFEFEDKTHVGVLMSDSSGYGLSSAFMSVILRLAVKLSKDEAKSPSVTVARIYEELALTMKPKEGLSIFYGVLNRKTFEFKYAAAGSIHFVHQSQEKSGAAQDYSSKAAPLNKEHKYAATDQTLQLLPGDRFVLFTDGFISSFKDEKSREQTMTQKFGTDPIELVNEFTFGVKKHLDEDNDMPARDCSVMVVDVEKRAMRLAK